MEQGGRNDDSPTSAIKLMNCAVNSTTIPARFPTVLNKNGRIFCSKSLPRESGRTNNTNGVLSVK